MAILTKDGYFVDPKIKQHISHAIEHGDMLQTNGITVHQTDGATAESAFQQYARGGNGAHFLIDKDGTIYQTASISKIAWHIGKLKCRCLAEYRCVPAEAKRIASLHPKDINDEEMKKKFPDRYPSNKDSVGIELVGQAFPMGKNIPSDKKIYENAPEKQNNSLKWLVKILEDNLRISSSEVYRHPTLSWKNISEASSAKW